MHPRRIRTQSHYRSTSFIVCVSVVSIHSLTHSKELVYHFKMLRCLRFHVPTIMMCSFFHGFLQVNLSFNSCSVASQLDHHKRKASTILTNIYTFATVSPTLLCSAPKWILVKYSAQNSFGHLELRLKVSPLRK